MEDKDLKRDKKDDMRGIKGNGDYK